LQIDKNFAENAENNEKKRDNNNRFKCDLFSINRVLIFMIYLINLGFFSMGILGLKMSYFDIAKNICINH
jgi:hypothetical protein